MDSRFSYVYLHDSRLVDLVDEEWLTDKFPDHEPEIPPKQQPPSQDDAEDGVYNVDVHQNSEDSKNQTDADNKWDDFDLNFDEEKL
ncbi:hypothetical protein BC937DRAFT_86580 [Endogone sp. FLAS-F59071]|nr:hypothetical protein BC937DRAFT_86580 [Endogone sp. FLAS-F59071]|eukprot:RUS19996.1 hypothetical protein BC937DRAFT_86580 [Endogone sp. FLAS-F59071]